MPYAVIGPMGPFSDSWADHASSRMFSPLPPDFGQFQRARSGRLSGVGPARVTCPTDMDNGCVPGKTRDKGAWYRRVTKELCGLPGNLSLLFPREFERA